MPDPDQPYDHRGEPEDGPVRYVERPDLEPAAQPDPGHTFSFSKDRDRRGLRDEA